MQFIINMLTSEVVWAAIIASGLTFLGVTLSNLSNRKSLKMQLDHIADEKDKEREMQLRRDIYLEGVEVIAEAIHDIEFLPKRIAKTDDMKLGDTLFSAIAKIHICGTIDTITSTSNFVEKYNDLLIPMIPMISKYSILKQELQDLVTISDIHLNSLKEWNRKWEQMKDINKNDSEIRAIHKKYFDETMREHTETLNSINEKNTQIKKLHIELMSICLKVSNELQKESLYIILSIRKELNLQINDAEYLSRMSAVLNKLEKYFTTDKLEQFMQA